MAVHRSSRRAAPRLAAAVAVAVGALIGLAAPAGAHHPEVEATVDCTGLVTFTATAWNGDTDASRTNDEIGVWVSVDGDAFDRLPQKDSYRFNKANDFTFTDDLRLPADAERVVVKVQALEAWANGGSPGESRQTGVLAVPACPSASIADATCAEGGAEVSLTNPDDAPVTFTIEKDGATVDSVEVAGDETATRLVPLEEDETATITVTAQGMEPVEKTVSGSCEQPAASVGAVECDDDGAVVTLDNGGSEQPVTFTVRKNDDVAATVEVPAGETDTVTVPITEDESATISVAAPGMTTVSEDVARDCEQPAAALGEVECAEGGAAVQLNNEDGAAPVTFTVAKDDTTVATVEVPGGSATTHLVPLAEDETATISIAAPGMETVSGMVTLDCVEPTAVTTPPDGPARPTDVAGVTSEREAAPAAERGVAGGADAGAGAGALAATGWGLVAFGLSGGALLVGGVGTLRLARVRRPEQRWQSGDGLDWPAPTKLFDD